MDKDISEEITTMLESITSTDALINAYMVESSTIINEGAITDSIQAVIAKLISFIRGLYEKFISLFLTQSDYIKYILDKHSARLHELTDAELKTIVYQYTQFNISKDLPIFGYIDNVQKYIDKLSSFKISFSDIEDFKDIFSEELSVIRGKILGKNEKIAEYDFIAKTRGIFRPNTEVFMKHMSKADLNSIISGVSSYKNTKSMIESNKDSLTREYNKYFKVISSLMSVKYSDDALGATITNNNGDKETVDLITVNKHKTYQSLIVSFISQIGEVYSIVYREKLLAIKDKYEMEMTILSQVIRLV